MAHPSKSKKCLSGVKCVVDTCEYNNHQSECMASSIEVEYKDAQTAKQTDCATFIPKTQ